MELIHVVVLVAPILIVFIGNIVRIKVLSFMVAFPIAMMIVIAWSQMYAVRGTWLVHPTERVGMVIAVLAVLAMLAYAHSQPAILDPSAVDFGRARRRRMARIRRKVSAEAQSFRVEYSKENVR